MVNIGMNTFKDKKGPVQFRVHNSRNSDYSYHNAYPDLKNQWAPSAKSQSYPILLSLIFILIGCILSQLYIHHSIPTIDPPVFVIDEPRVENVKQVVKEDFINYASLTNGATVIHDNKDTLKALSSDNSPGNCFNFKGSRYLIPIKLKYPIRPTSFSMYHINALNYFESPKKFRVYKLDPAGSYNMLMGEYEYINSDTYKKTFQFFPCENYCEEIQEIAFEILSNYGLTSTCVYEIGVHGILKQ